MVLGIAVAALGRPKVGWLVHICGLQAAGIGIVSLLGYLWNATELVTDVWLPPVAINTGLAFAWVGLGVMAAQASFAKPERNEVALSRVEIKLMLAVAGALVVLITSAGFTYSSVVQFLHRTDRIVASQQSRVDVQKTLGLVAMTVAGYHPAQAAGDPMVTRQYLQDLSGSEAALRELLLLRPDAPLLIERIETLTGLIRAQFSALQPKPESATPQELVGLTAAAARANTALLAEVDLMGDFLEDTYKTSLAQQNSALQSGRTTMLVSLIVTIGLSIAVFVGLMSSVRRETGRNSRARGEISELNALLERRVVERTAELSEAHERFNAFTYSLAHDLRQPLISVGGFGHLLEQRLEQSGDAKSRKFLQRIRAAVTHVGVCTDALLELGRVSRAELRLQTVDMTALAEKLIADLRKQHPERTVRVSVEHAMSAQADAGLLRVAMGHLIANAWKFSSGRADPRIEVGSGMALEGREVWWVKDNGVGFDMAYSNKLFTPFQRLHREDEFVGTGTGLAIVQAVVARHRGRIWVDAVPGKGATFYFTLGESQG